MLDVGWSELLVIGVVALIVVGPKDLPILFRRLGEFTGRMRSMAREFTSAMNQAADDAGMRELQRSLHDIANPRDLGLDAMRGAARDFAAGMADTATAPPSAPPSGPQSAPPSGPAPEPAAAAAAPAATAPTAAVPPSPAPAPDAATGAQRAAAGQDDAKA